MAIKKRHLAIHSWVEFTIKGQCIASDGIGMEIYENTRTEKGNRLQLSSKEAVGVQDKSTYVCKSSSILHSNSVAGKLLGGE